jgi:hypothetical protein
MICLSSSFFCVDITFEQCITKMMPNIHHASVMFYPISLATLMERVFSIKLISLYQLKSYFHPKGTRGDGTLSTARSGSTTLELKK